jgi:hypothetical protein
MVTYLPFLNVTSKFAGREWCFPGGRFCWVGWDSREKTIPVIGEMRQRGSGNGSTSSTSPVAWSLSSTPKQRMTTRSAQPTRRPDSSTSMAGHLDSS